MTAGFVRGSRLARCFGTGRFTERGERVCGFLIGGERESGSVRWLRPVLTSEPVVRSDPASGGHKGLFLLLARSSFLPLFFSTEASTAKSGGNKPTSRRRTRQAGKISDEAYVRQTCPYVRTCRSSTGLLSLLPRTVVLLFSRSRKLQSLYLYTYTGQKTNLYNI